MKLTRLGIACLSAGALYGGETSARRLPDSAEGLTALMSAPDRGIPQELLEKARWVVIVPGLKKGAFIFGGKYGRGYFLGRAASGNGWSAPAGVTVEGG